MGGTRKRHEEMRDTYKIYGWETLRKEPFGKIRREWEDNIKIELSRLVSL
jgi:hypothetical protein